MSSIKKNLFYNTAYQLLNMLLPFVTVPLISRALGPENSGVYSYTYSIVNYFMIFGMLGISNYGNRKIAKSRDNKELLSKNFISIYLLQVLFNSAALFLYLIYVGLFSEYKIISLIEVLFLISNALDISWLYFGLEKFKITVTRNIFVKIISLLLIIFLVKTPDDLVIYTIIMAASTFMSQAILWRGIKRYIDFRPHSLKKKLVLGHVKGILVLFVPVIAYSIYRIMDKIMLGMQSSMVEVGYYEYAEKIIGIPLGFITAFGTVMLPQASNLIANRNIGKTKEYLEKSLRYIMFVTIPCVFGLIAISHSFSILFLGDDYARTGDILNFLVVTLFFTAWANIVRTQWLIPQEKDYVYVTTTIAGAIVNLIVNLLLIPKYGGIGAAIGTIMAEFTIMFSQSFLVRKELDFSKLFPDIIKYLATGGIMLGLCFVVDIVVGQWAVLSVVVKIVVGAMVYLSLNYKSIKELLYVRKN